MKILVTISILIVSVFFASLYLHAEPKTLSDLDKERDKLNSEIEKLKNENVKFDENTLKNENDIKKLNDEINNIRKAMEQMNTKIKQADDDYNLQRKSFSKTFTLMYENLDTNSSILKMMFSSKSLEDFLDKYQMTTFIVGKDKEILDNYKMAKQEVDNNKKLKEDLISVDQNSIIKNNTSIQSIKGNKDSLIKSQDEINKQVSVLNGMESDMLAESINITYALSKITGGKYVGGNMRWPVSNYQAISCGFGYRTSPITGRSEFHTGLDIAANYGVSITAANAGKVIEAGWKGGYGNAVMIDHGGGIVTLYGHASSLVAKVGDSVEAGKVISKVGSTGASTGNHCHFEVRVNGIPQSPLNYVSQPK